VVVKTMTTDEEVWDMSKIYALDDNWLWVNVVQRFTGWVLEALDKINR
jgi:hypothetical protein